MNEISKRIGDSRMKAILKYPGSKWSIAKWIIDFFPDHHSYHFEPVRQMELKLN